MVGPIRFEGVVSGFNYTEIIETILQYQQRPIEIWQERINTYKQKKMAYMEIQATILGLKAVLELLAKPSFYNRTTVSSSNPDIIDASGSQVGSLGAFTFRSHRLAQAHQIISNGFADKDQTAITSTDGEIRIEFGDYVLDKATSLSFLNAQSGVDRGSIKITQGSSSAVINLEGAMTVQDVVDEINNAVGVNVSAYVMGDRIVIEADSSFEITNYGLDTTASDLGIAGSSQVIDGKYYLFGQQINRIDTSTKLSYLNDGLGVRYETGVDFVIEGTTAAGTDFSVSIDIDSNDITIGDVIDKINSATASLPDGATITAKINPDATGIMLSGTSLSSISTNWQNNSLSAVDLGLGVVSGATFYFNDAQSDPVRVIDLGSNNLVVLGTRIIPTLNSTLRNNLNGGMTVTNNSVDVKGVRNGVIQVTDRLGAVADINLYARVQTSLSSNVSAGSTSATVASTDGFGVGNKLYLIEGNNFEVKTITRISGNTIYFDDQPLSNDYTTSAVIVAPNETTAEMMNTFNYQAGAQGVQVSIYINPAKNGFYIRDTSGGTQNLIIQDTGTGYTAEDLGIKTDAGGVAESQIIGEDVDYGYISQNTLLSSLNFGEGVAKGKIRIYYSGGEFEVDLSQEEDNTIGRVIYEINNAAGNPGSVVAYINDTGDGIIITGITKIEDVDASTAFDLNISGDADENNQINGSFEKAIQITAGSKLEDVAKAINSSALPLSASIINTGSAENPYKLIITSKKTGLSGRMLFSTDIDGLSFNTLVRPQNSILIFGEDSGEIDPEVMTSGSNVYTDVISGLTLKLKSESDSPVTITVERDKQGIIDQVSTFVERYNAIIDKIDEHGSYNVETETGGVLYPDTVIFTIERQLGYMIVSPVKEIPVGQPRSFQDIGIKITDTGKITFDSSKLESLLDTDFEKVEALFTKQRKLSLDTLLEDFNNGNGVGEVVGDDFKIYTRDAKTPIVIDISGVKTFAELQSRVKFDSENNGRIEFKISSDGFYIEVVDSSTPETHTDIVVTGTYTFTSNDLATDSGYTEDSVVGATIKIGSWSSKVTAFDKGTGEVTVEDELPASPTSFTVERELEVVTLNSSPTAYDLGIRKKADLGVTTIKSDLINLPKDPGLAFNSVTRLDRMLDEEAGLIPKRLEGYDKSIEDLEESIERLEERLQRETERLVRLFAQLESIIASAQAIMARLQAFSTGNTQLLGMLQAGGTSLRI